MAPMAHRAVSDPLSAAVTRNGGRMMGIFLNLRERWRVQQIN
jgi:hypothetical protein